MSSGDGEFSHRLSQPALRCKNQCGFYGNPMYQGYCSKCYKEVTAESQKRIQETSTFVDQGESSEASGGLGFGKFTKRKTIFNSAKGHGKLFKTPIKIRPVSGANATTVSSGGPVSTNSDLQESVKSTKSRRGSDPFNEFMKTLKKPAAQDIVQHLKTFKRQISDKSSSATVNEQSDSVQEFYRSTLERLQSHPLFKTMSEEEQEETMDGIEKHLMTSIYNYVYSPASCDDEMKDLLLLRRINMLHWLEPSILDVALDMVNHDVQQVFEQARQELWNMESKKAPQDKLTCISRSCKLLLEALRVSRGGPASADEFFPSLLFLIIHTNPQHLHSNINYISRFSNPMRVMSGEAGYYFTNLCGAVTFIENVTAESLKIPQEEFNKKMGYVNGKTDADLLIEEDNVEEDLQLLYIVESCCEAMKEINDRLQNMSSEMDDMSGRLDEFKTGIKEQVHSILSLPPPPSLYRAPSPLPPRRLIVEPSGKTRSSSFAVSELTSQTGQTSLATSLPSPPPLMTFDD